LPHAVHLPRESGRRWGQSPFNWEDIEERGRFLGGIDKDLAEIKADKVAAHEDVKTNLKR